MSQRKASSAPSLGSAAVSSKGKKAEIHDPLWDSAEDSGEDEQDSIKRQMYARKRMDNAVASTAGIRDLSKNRIAQGVEALRDEMEGSGGSGESEEATHSAADTHEAVDYLREMSVLVQRISAMQQLAKYRKGRCAMNGPRREKSKSQRIFGLEGSRTLVDIENADGIYDELNTGETLYARIIARTGIGKTTRFPAAIAEKCQMRVLQLEPDSLLVRSAEEAQKTLTNVKRHWTKTRKAHLTIATYADFCGWFHSQGGAMALEQYDIVIMDEAHIPFAEVYAARALFAAYSKGTTSLLVATATVDGDDSQAISATTSVGYFDRSLATSVARGMFTSGTASRDRTMLIMASDEEASIAASTITDSGHIAFTLDSASRYEDYVRVCDGLRSNSVVKRFLVVPERYGTGYNFPVSHVYSSGRRVVSQVQEDRSVRDVQVPVTVSEMKQHMGRVGRGIVSGATKVACISEDDISEDVELLDSERFRAYLLLRAADVVPVRDLLPDTGIIPFGVTPEVAMDILAINLPPQIAIRYFALDGRVPSSFVSALALYSHVGHYFLSSEHDMPLGASEWVASRIGKYYDSQKVYAATVDVPCELEGEMRVKVHAISAIAGHLYQVDTFVPMLSDSEGSGDESVVARPTRRVSYVPRQITLPVRSVPTAPSVVEPYAYKAPVEGQFGYARSRQAIDGSGFAGHVQQFLANLDTTVTDYPQGCELRETISPRSGRKRIEINQTPEGVIDVQSPRGSLLVSIRQSVWDAMTDGSPLNEKDAVSLIRDVKHCAQRFAESNVFANWNNAWISILNTFADAGVWHALSRRFASVDAMTFLFYLYSRYVTGVTATVQGSFALSRFWSRVCMGRSFKEQLAVDKRKGKTDIRQSERFLRRVYEIRRMFANAIQTSEECDVYAPILVTQMQDLLPLMRTTNVEVVDSVTNRSKVTRLLMPMAQPSSGTTR